uniref:C2H2-type domain-containing protein n=1 Tax=Mola mola TaxID=94237 RepID=A0A3Q3WY99_MOLML
MLQPDPVQLRTEGQTPAKSCDEDRPMGNSGEPRRSGVVEDSPFNFAPQIIRLHKDHELFEDGDICRHMYLQDLYTSENFLSFLSVSEFACHISGCCAVFSTLEEYEHHYNSLHRNVCSSCRRSLPSARLLDIHIQEWHDALFTILAQRQDMYQCLVEGCGQKFRTSKRRKDHLIRIHKYPPDFRFDKTKEERRTRRMRSQQQKDTAMEVADSMCESEGMFDALSRRADPGESMEMHACEEEAARMANSALTEEHVNRSGAVHTGTETPKPRYSYRVPATVCFGHGSVRGFRGRRGRRK